MCSRICNAASFLQIQFNWSGFQSVLSQVKYINQDCLWSHLSTFEFFFFYSFHIDVDWTECIWIKTKIQILFLGNILHVWISWNFVNCRVCRCAYESLVHSGNSYAYNVQGSWLSFILCDKLVFILFQIDKNFVQPHKFHSKQI